MRTVKTLFLCAGLLGLVTFAATPPADNDVNQVIQSALQPSTLEANLHRLTDQIGGRVPGTVAMQHAVEWGTQAFTAAGADSVHAEGFSIPNSWAEGTTEMIATSAYQISATKVRWNPSVSLPRSRRVHRLGAGARAGQTRSHC